MPLDPPSNSVTTQCYGATYTLLGYYLFRKLALFKGIFEECLSDIYLLDLTEVKQAYMHLYAIVEKTFYR